MNGISAVERSQNRKVGDVSATYASQKTCSPTCPFYNSGCYAELGLTGFTTRRVNYQQKRSKITALDLAQREAKAIGKLSGKRPCRLHVVGDCTTDLCALIVSTAADEYRSRHGKPVWTYTHSWRDVNRQSWGNVSVLASCETTADVRIARALGYATAVVVEKHASDKAYVQDGIKMIPCPQQTHKSVTCESCKLCFDDKRLRAIGGTIAFASHGATKKVKQALTQISLG
jgi:hypothetical protein